MTPDAGLQPAAGWSSQPAAGLQPAAGWTSQPAVFLDCFVAALLAMTFFIPSFRAQRSGDAESTRRMDSASCDFAQDDTPDGSAQNDSLRSQVHAFAVVPAGYWIPCHSRVGGNFAGMTKGRARE